VHLAGAAEALRESINHKLETPDRAFREDYLAKPRTALSKTMSKDAIDKARKLAAEDLIALTNTKT